MSGNILFLGNKIFEIPPFFQIRPGDLGKKVHTFSLRFSALKQKPCIDSGASRGGAWEANLPLFLDQTEARRAENKIFKTAPPPPPNPYSHPLYQSLDEPLSEGLDLPLIDIPYMYVAY